MPEETLADKIAEESLPAADETTTESKDVTAESSTATTTAKPNETAPTTMQEAVKAAVKKAGSESKPDEEEVEEKTEKEGEEEEETPAEETKEEKTDEKGPVPYERFEEINQAKARVQQEYDAIKPVAEAHKKIVEYCESNSITQEQFAQVLEVQALLNTDPAKALERLLPIVESLQGFTGNKLPDDLQKEVDDGSLPAARAREIAQLRQQSKFGDTKAQQAERKRQESAARGFEVDVQRSIATWTDGKKKTDPGFKPKASANAPDGKFEMVCDRFSALAAQRQLRTTAEYVEVAEMAYKAISQALAGMVPKKTVSKSLTSSGSSTSITKEPETMLEAVQQKAAKLGLR